MLRLLSDFRLSVDAFSIDSAYEEDLLAVSDPLSPSVVVFLISRAGLVAVSDQRFRSGPVSNLFLRMKRRI